LTATLAVRRVLGIAARRARHFGQVHSIWRVWLIIAPLLRFGGDHTSGAERLN
jgi:hypothetical protein